MTRKISASRALNVLQLGEKFSSKFCHLRADDALLHGVSNDKTSRANFNLAIPGLSIPATASRHPA